MEVRLARNTPEDRESFLRLWREFLKEQEEWGGDIPPTRDNLLEYLKLYDSYLQGSLFGFCLLGEESDETMGVLLAGEFPLPFQFQSSLPGRQGQLFGVYVVPEWRRGGVAWALQDRAVEEGLRLGFRRVRSWVLWDYPAGEANALGWGAQPLARVIEFDLMDPHGQALRGPGEEDSDG